MIAKIAEIERQEPYRGLNADRRGFGKRKTIPRIKTDDTDQEELPKCQNCQRSPKLKGKKLTADCYKQSTRSFGPTRKLKKTLARLRTSG
jgi:hypothetical protein